MKRPAGSYIMNPDGGIEPNLNCPAMKARTASSTQPAEKAKVASKATRKEVKTDG
jgi:hypothetical protein